MSGEPAERRRLEALLSELEPIAEQTARRYFIPGAERDDVRQIAMIGIWQAIESWDGSQELGALARTIAERRVVDAIKKAHREKRRSDREALSLALGGGDDPREIVADLPARENVERQAEVRAEIRAALATLPRLTPLERRSLALALSGVCYWDRAPGSDQSVKNAVIRARAKLGAAVAAERAA